MPLYEYECAEHGVFEAQREHRAVRRGTALARSAARGSPRIVSATNLGRIERSQVRAMDRNEKSRHEPRSFAPSRAGRPAPRRSARRGRLPLGDRARVEPRAESAGKAGARKRLTLSAPSL